MGKRFEVSVPHSLSQEEALSRVKSLVNDLKGQYGDQVSNVSETWHGNRCDFSLKVKMFKLSGTIEVDDSSARIVGTLPTGAGRFEGKAKSLIEERARKLLS